MLITESHRREREVVRWALSERCAMLSLIITDHRWRNGLGCSSQYTLSAKSVYYMQCAHQRKLILTANPSFLHIYMLLLAVLGMSVKSHKFFCHSLLLHSRGMASFSPEMRMGGINILQG